MTDMAPITDHFRQAIVKLAPPFWGRPRIASLLRAVVNRVQDLEDMTWDVMSIYTIDAADGPRLDVLGKIVGLPRFTSDNELYRATLRGKIRANRSRGLVNDIVEVIQQTASVTTPVAVKSLAPATMLVELGEVITAARQKALELLLPKTRAVGVQMHEVFPPTANHLVWASAVSGGGTAFASAVTGGTNSAYSVRRL